MIKPAYQQPIDKATYAVTVQYFENILKVLHPFMPFLSEELWHDELFGERAEKDCCIVAQLPNIGEINAQTLSHLEIVKIIITQIRNIRNTKQISPKESLDLAVKANSGLPYQQYEPIITKLANIGTFSLVNDKLNGAINFIASTDEFYVPLSENVDPVAERARLEKEKEYLLGFLKSVNAKLNNERFMANAKPEVIDVEQKKRADAEAKLTILEENLTALAD
jgi:valyl-tRNA synthetase